MCKLQLEACVYTLILLCIHHIIGYSLELCDIFLISCKMRSTVHFITKYFVSEYDNMC